MDVGGAVNSELRRFVGNRFSHYYIPDYLTGFDFTPYAHIGFDMPVVAKYNISFTVMLYNYKGIPVVFKAGSIGVCVVKRDCPVADCEHWGVKWHENINACVVAAEVARAKALSNLVAG